MQGAVTFCFSLLYHVINLGHLPFLSLKIRFSFTQRYANKNTWSISLNTMSFTSVFNE